MDQSRAFLFIAPPYTEIFTLSLHDALPIFHHVSAGVYEESGDGEAERGNVPHADLRRAHDGNLHAVHSHVPLDRKSTRLNSSHRCISYAVFCLKKKMSIYE